MFNYAKLSDMQNLHKSKHRVVRAKDAFVQATFNKHEAILNFPNGYSVVPSHLFSVKDRHVTHGYGSVGYASPKFWDNNPDGMNNSKFFFLLRDVYMQSEGNMKIPNAACEEVAKSISGIAFSSVKEDSNGMYAHGYGWQDWCHSPSWDDYRNVAEHNLIFEVTMDSHQYVVMSDSRICERLFNLKFTEDMEFEINGLKIPITNWKDLLEDSYSYYDRNYTKRTSVQFDYTLEAINHITGSKLPMDRNNAEIFLKAVEKKEWPVLPLNKTEGISKTLKKIEPFFDDMKKEDPVAFCALRSFAHQTGKSIESVKNSVVFNELMGNVSNKDDLIKVMHDFWLGADLADKQKTYYGGRYSLEEAIKSTNVWKEKRKGVLKSQGNRAFGKLMQEIEFLNLDEESYPLTTAAIKDSKIHLGTFFRKNEQYFLLNDNWQLWEEMLALHEDKAIELANEVKGRTTYEKDLMSYFYFVLHALPDYLEKHTGHKWTCIPKLVNTQDELTPPEPEDNGISRKRSALTPIVDNENHTVEVPYASLAVGGSYGTTYCYSHDYHVLTKGFSFNGNAVMNDLDEKLNGKDDYGLMFYTLTGSSQGRGYPTFLIIFERRHEKGDTKVHFHRTHPTRSKQGDYNPIHNWTKVCYNWMAGNINKKLIKAQQGDLFFVETTDDLEFAHKVNAYDKHTFEEGVDFAEYKKAAKSNILGYVSLERDMRLRHTEHDDVTIPAGKYAIHQCRSWEANPQGVWSLRVD